MKKLFVIKAGTTYLEIRRQLGDFDVWTEASMGATDLTVEVVDITRGLWLPDAGECAGVVVTGSHAMVTEHLDQSLRIERWLATLIDRGVPYFGICYGHQLLAQAMDGKVGYHPEGVEVGTVDVELLPGFTNDALFQAFPERFLAHATHQQTVLRLPPGAVRLAANRHEPNHAFRIGHSAWGVQFHPEYGPDIMRAYILAEKDDLRARGVDPAVVLEGIRETPFAAQILRRFACFVEQMAAA
jgi:GMP synthase (glutamine-hydrolysing)